MEKSNNHLSRSARYILSCFNKIIVESFVIGIGSTSYPLNLNLLISVLIKYMTNFLKENGQNSKPNTLEFLKTNTCFRSYAN